MSGLTRRWSGRAGDRLIKASAACGVAVVQWVAQADSYVTDPEAQRLRAIIKELGEKAYHAASEAADRRFADTEALKTFLRGIDRQEARELIYVTALEVGLSDARMDQESEVFDWLSRTWQLKVKVDPTDKRSD